MYAHRGNALAEILTTYKRAEQRQRSRGRTDRATTRSAAAPARDARDERRSLREHR